MKNVFKVVKLYKTENKDEFLVRLDKPFVLEYENLWGYLDLVGLVVSDDMHGPTQFLVKEVCGPILRLTDMSFKKQDTYDLKQLFMLSHIGVEYSGCYGTCYHPLVAEYLEAAQKERNEKTTKKDRI